MRRIKPQTLLAACALSLAALSVSMPAVAQDASTAREMVRNCHVAVRLNMKPSSVSDQELPAATFCMGWAQGMLDGITATNDDMEKATGTGRLTSPNCIASGQMEIGTAIMAFLNYAETNPPSVSQGEGQMMFEALSKTYPCNRK